ncbi:MAG: 8-amino-7-oxononanoate synthase, partial [Deltaproteobacteria bacterium]|nr:8-amino-7-oxononanoate synthase [Deltaproteobacteria bacterium]
GIFANPVISPAVPKGGALIRTSYMATHERKHLDRALEVLAQVGREVGII